ncbi:uncharacterized protein LOC134194277 [Corticium candelabrum]|uniref:uncharacterized protein LOC134194277 n=1 Tax=Corticium candelabrum TaxID=121492 RepID=UPI002E266ADB|nr:uncharacterized protein LOC134194277 [Corticium candelabrum]
MLRSTSVLQLFIYVVVYSADSDFNSHPLRSYEYRLSEKTHYGHLFEATDFNFEVLLNDLGDGGIQLVFSQPEDTAKGLDGLEDWFSFKRDEKGVVTKVLYSSRSSSEVLMRKKAVAGILSMSLEVVTD